MMECSSGKVLIVRMSWDDPPTQQVKNSRKLPGEHHHQGHEVVHHDQGEGYQHPRSESGSVPQDVKKVSCLGPKFHILV